MIEDLNKALERLHGMKIELPIEKDADGYYDKQCPADGCGFHFKVLGEDWRDLCRDEQVFCPMCRNDEVADEFVTTDQMKHGTLQAMLYFGVELTRALHEEAEAFNRKQPQDTHKRPEMRVYGRKTHKPLEPLPAQEEILHKITCEECGCRFAIIGSAFFCPACGYSAAVRVFDDSMTKIDAKVKYLETIRNAVSEFDKDQAELVCRSMLETGLSDGVVALQRVFDQLYSQQPVAVLPLKHNVFQRLDDGSDLWKNLIGKGYGVFLTAPELDRLNVLFQRRHLLSHSEGIVDQKYIYKTKDNTYKVGQRIVVNKQDVLDMVQIIKKLVLGYLGDFENVS